MKKNNLQEYDFDQFLYTFLPSEKRKDNIRSTTYEEGKAISQSALEIINKTIHVSLDKKKKGS